MHYANSGFQDVSSRLAREAGAVAMEADRYRAAAQHSSMQCHGAVLAYTHAQEELTAAEQQLQSLLNAEEQKQKAVDEVQKQKEALQSPTAASDPSIVALTLQLDQELATMRTRKHRYELLCTQKAHLEAKVEDWTAKERRLEAKLEREQVRRGRELEDALRRVHAKPSFPEEQLLTDQASRSKARLHDFDVCITERLELLRHLQDGSATRLEQLTTLLTRTRERSGNDVCNEQSTRKEVNQQMLATYSTAEGKSAGERQQNRSHVGNADGETSRGGATMKLLEYLSTMHKTVLLGEEAALKEMEHVRVLLHRLQRQESSQSAMEKTTSIHS
ncbi:hypothetical protein ABB37_01387 [Leptomonas pyrrhocoris]|uniref:Uncharacterized protein n=1 Tax=Leptomonas pyrrhocoris TaxID=157538 RepID=A0A0N0DZ67_LEPPY|nr:hypothetical protein ABB37_01387 [Leptomonas pyrrhocoris]XP_015663384.1 hypothetical protein ABB37_01387 [Leptomonas pyrrhocoris]KPA84944.1 hypothetical protein ABB37_01387 [Leptomonas pyrrhocoris]KPA84945.1 hypothetical protein ABB37_01387 [Leptomonas pyrrhocoris]|eukprot:XP_015663383.1 hypothetical protein ABB37_01387 [Leptomonas pyrrhocoris]